jgi:hypothetical protein
MAVMAWEHALLGDIGPAQIGAAAAGDGGPVEDYRDLLTELGRAPRAVNGCAPSTRNSSPSGCPAAGWSSRSAS